MFSWDTLDALSHAFELNDIDASTRAIVVLDPDPDPNLAALVQTAIERSRAEAVVVRMMGKRGAKLLTELIGHADVVIDLRTPQAPSRLGESPDAVAGTNARLLRILPAAIDADRWPPHASLANRVSQVADIVARSRVIHLSDDHGSELTVTLDDARISADGGRTELAGSSTTFPTGWVRLVPGSGTVDGDLVLMPGDGLLTRQTHFRSPIRLSIRQDRIARIDGDHGDGDLLRALFQAMGTVDAYGIAEISLGLNAGGAGGDAVFHSVLADPDLAALASGVVCIAFGDNLPADRPCPGTIAMALAGRSLRADDAVLCQAGILTGEAAPDVYERAQ